MMPKSTEQINAHTQTVQAIFRKQKKHALKLRRSTAEERLAWLNKLKQAILDNQEAMCEAAYADFNKTPAEDRFIAPTLLRNVSNDSGIGKAHGVHGFKAFSNERAVVEDKFSMSYLMFPPYTPRVRKLIQLAMRYLT